jgi:hypothetical protein
LPRNTSPPPRLRPIEPHYTSHAGQRGFVLQDRLQLAEQTLFVPQALALALNFFDGVHDLDEICAAYQENYGEALSAKTLREFIRALDEACLLDSPRAAQAKANKLAQFRATPSRPTICAKPNGNGGYPASATRLKRTLNEYLDQSPSALLTSLKDLHATRGLVSPHIDFGRGGAVYAQAWRAAAPAAQQAELVVILGTDHYGGEAQFTLTRQNYATPYGVLPTAQAVVNTLAEAIGAQAAFEAELYHTVEHSLELPLVWLHHMRHGQPVDVVPVLVGSLHPFMRTAGNGGTRLPADSGVITSFLGALAAGCAGKRTLVIASGDLAHVGPAFGGQPLTAHAKAALQTEDEALLETIATGDADAWFNTLARHHNKNNVCGLAPVYLTLKLLQATQGHTVGYAMCPADEAATSVVSICGSVLE